MIIIAFLGVVLLAASLGGVYAAFRAPQFRRSENLEQIDAYGYAARNVPVVAASRQVRKALDAAAAALGAIVAKRVQSVREDDVQRELISAGYFTIGARKFVGYRVLFAIAFPLMLVWLGGLLGANGVLLLFVGLGGVALGWMGPTIAIRRRARMRFQEIDDALPELVDLLAVTLEAGAGFLAALRMASERIGGPLGDEIRLTVQEQTLGLSISVALKNWLVRCDTPSVRSFVRSMVQGDHLGVSIGQILRNQAVEMRARRKQVIEERAQKTAIKILFPLILLIFPAMFAVILGPAVLEIFHSLK
jgi:tight adherence protein C